MDETIRRLRSEAQQLARGKAPRAIRYPRAFRATAVAIARAQLERGVPVRRVARALGLPAWSLARWLQFQPEGPSVVRPVTVAPEPAPAPRAVNGPVLITPQGFRVEGLDATALLAVLRALA